MMLQWTDPSEAYAAPVMRDTCQCPHLDSILPTVLQVNGCGLFAQTGEKTTTHSNSLTDSISLIHNLHMKSDKHSSLSSPSSSSPPNNTKTAMTYPYGKEQYRFDAVSSGGLSDYYCPLIPPRYTQRYESKYVTTRKRSSPSSVTEPERLQEMNVVTLSNDESWTSNILQRQEKILKMKKPLMTTALTVATNQPFKSTTSIAASMDREKKTTPSTRKTTQIGNLGVKKKSSSSTIPRQHDHDEEDHEEDNDSRNTIQNKQTLARASLQVESWLQVLKDNRLRYWQSLHVARRLQKKRLHKTTDSSYSFMSQHNPWSTNFDSTASVPPLHCQWCVDDKSSSTSTNSIPYVFYSSDTLMQCLDCSFIGCGPLAMDVSATFLPTSKQHIRQHFLLSGHSLGITCGPLSGIYCMQCGDFIHHEAFENEIQRIKIQQNAKELGWNRNRPVIRSFKYMDFIVSPDTLFESSASTSGSSSVVWRGFHATYPFAKSRELVSAVSLTYLRMQIFRGDFSIHHYLQLDRMALHMTRPGKYGRIIEKIHAPVGLYNLGNTCFLNCVLQCLVHCDSFQKYFLVDVKHNYMACPHLKRAFHTTNQRISSACLGCEMDKVILTAFGRIRGINMRRILEDSMAATSLPILSSSPSITLSSDLESENKGSPIVISDFLMTVRKCRTMSRLKGHMQHDAHEFLQDFLDSLGKHCRIYTKHLNQLRVEASSSTFKTALNDESIQSVDIDVSTDTFGGELRSLLICGKCGRKRLQREPYMNISLPLAKELMLQPEGCIQSPFATKLPPCKASLSLLSCLEHFTTPEALVDPVFCVDCGEKTPTLKQHTFAKLSRVVCFHLKRFDFQTNKKITEPVTFPTSLNMGSYLPGWREVIQGDIDSLSDLARLNPREDESVTPLVMYDLFATIEHTGSLNQGHYVSNVKINGKWYHCNDSIVSHTVEANVMNSENVYMLFYTRRNI